MTILKWILNRAAGCTLDFFRSGHKPVCNVRERSNELKDSVKTGKFLD